MSRTLSLLTTGLMALATVPAISAEAVDPAVAAAEAANAKLRDALRKSMLDLRTAQTDLATAQAGQAAAEAQVKELTSKSESAAKQAAANEAEAKKKQEELAVRNASLENVLKLAKDKLDQYGTEYPKVVAIANEKETERAKLSDENAILKAKVRDHKAQNLQLFTLANEILTRYEKFSVGDALKAREPFTGVTRARLETQVQDYRDKVEDLRMPSEPAKKDGAAAKKNPEPSKKP